MIYHSVKDFPHHMLLKEKEIAISLYMPTHKGFFDTKQDILVFKNLVKEITSSLRKKYQKKEIEDLLKSLKSIEYDHSIWHDSNLGLVFFATLDDMVIYKLDQPVNELAIVASSFHIKPLISYHQGAQRYVFLALEGKSFQLYVGNKHEVMPYELDSDVKTTLSEILGDEYTDSYQTHGSYGGTSNSSTFHGHGGKKAEIDIDKERFFRAVDRIITDLVSKKLNLPVILVSLKEHHALYQEIAGSRYLIEDTIEGSYEDFKEEAFKALVKKISDQRFDSLVQKEIAHYHHVKHENLSSDQLIDIIKALLEAKVQTLMVEKGKIIPGKIDKEKQGMIKSDLDDPETDDLLDDMIELAYDVGAKVFVLDKAHMPSKSGVAAIFRY